MPAWPGKATPQGQLPVPGWLLPFHFFQESLASETRSVQTLAQGSALAHPARSPLRSQTEAFHGFRSSTRSSSRRRLEWVTESDSRKRRHSDLLSQQKFQALGSPPSRRARSCRCARGPRLPSPRQGYLARQRVAAVARKPEARPHPRSGTPLSQLQPEAGGHCRLFLAPRPRAGSSREAATRNQHSWGPEVPDGMRGGCAPRATPATAVDGAGGAGGVASPWWEPVGHPAPGTRVAAFVGDLGQEEKSALTGGGADPTVVQARSARSPCPPLGAHPAGSPSPRTRPGLALPSPTSPGGPKPIGAPLPGAFRSGSRRRWGRTHRTWWPLSRPRALGSRSADTRTPAPRALRSHPPLRRPPL